MSSCVMMLVCSGMSFKALSLLEALTTTGSITWVVRSSGVSALSCAQEQFSEHAKLIVLKMKKRMKKRIKGLLVNNALKA